MMALKGQNLKHFATALVPAAADVLIMADGYTAIGCDTICRGKFGGRHELNGSCGVT